VSEYQYYEFRSLDRELTDREIDALEAISTRAQVTPTSFTNHYDWGDLKADPFKLLEKYFDAFVYVSDWGTRRFCLRLPKASIEPEQVQRLLNGDRAWTSKSRQHLILGFEISELDPDFADDGTRWLQALVPYVRIYFGAISGHSTWDGFSVCKTRSLTMKNLHLGPSRPRRIIKATPVLD
jgi:hypothetical protein